MPFFIVSKSFKQDPFDEVGIFPRHGLCYSFHKSNTHNIILVSSSIMKAQSGTPIMDYQYNVLYVFPRYGAVLAHDEDRASGGVR